jgi:predicted nuclease with RNAse H fold
VWAGVDVGGTRKGFHVVVIDRKGIVAGPSRICSPTGVADWLRTHAPLLTAVDSPISSAPPGATTRPGERALNKAVCGIRWTPDEERLCANPNGYYGWILNGLDLYAVLREAGFEVIECFPTASWTRWAGKKGSSRTRASWTRKALQERGLANLPPRTNQDDRDAIASAITARLHSDGKTESFDDIVVPLGTQKAGVRDRLFPASGDSGPSRPLTRRGSGENLLLGPCTER